MHPLVHLGWARIGQDLGHPLVHLGWARMQQDLTQKQKQFQVPVEAIQSDYDAVKYPWPGLAPDAVALGKLLTDPLPS